MVEIVGVLLVEEIGAPTMYEPPNTFLPSQMPSQPTNNLSSQEFSMRHQKTGRFTCKFSKEAVKLKIIQGNLVHCESVTVKRMIKDEADVKDEKPAGHSTCPTSSASHSTSSTSDSTCGDHTVQQLLEEGDHSVVQLLEENPQKSEEDHTCFHATSPFSSSSLKTMSSVSSSPVNSSIASSTVNSSIPYLQNSCFS